jgi:hypothetical protein
MINHKTHFEITPLDYKEFVRRYKRDIILAVDLKDFCKATFGLEIATDRTYLYHPMGDVLKRPKRYNIKDGKTSTIVRIPCFKIYKSFMILDGNHRIRELKPKIVIIDFINITEKNIPYCQDLSNVYWKEYFNRKGKGFVW